MLGEIFMKGTRVYFPETEIGNIIERRKEILFKTFSSFENITQRN